MRYDTQSEIYSKYNDHYDPSTHQRDTSSGYYVDGVWVEDVPKGPAKLKPYHMKGRILTYLSFPLGLATIVMILVAFVGPVTSNQSANITFLCLVTGFLAVLLGLLGKIRGRKELDLPRWPSSFGMLLGFLGCGVAAMVVFASAQTYMNYGDMLAQLEEEKQHETVVSYGLDDEDASSDEKSESKGDKSDKNEEEDEKDESKDEKAE